MVITDPDGASKPPETHSTLLEQPGKLLHKRLGRPPHSRSFDVGSDGAGQWANPSFMLAKWPVNRASLNCWSSTSTCRIYAVMLEASTYDVWDTHKLARMNQRA